MTNYYIQPTGEQLFNRYYGNKTVGRDNINWIPVAVSIGMVVVAGIAVYVHLKKVNGNILQLKSQDNRLGTAIKINRHSLSGVKTNVSEQARSINELRRELALLKLRVELNEAI